MQILEGFKEGMLKKDWSIISKTYYKITGELIEVAEDPRQELYDQLINSGVNLLEIDEYSIEELKEIHALQSGSFYVDKPKDDTVAPIKKEGSLYYPPGVRKLTGDIDKINLPANDPVMDIKANEDNFQRPEKRPPARKVRTDCKTCGTSFMCKPELVFSDGQGETYGICAKCSS